MSKYLRYHANYSSPKTNMPVGLFVAVGHLVDRKILSDDEIKLYWEQRHYFERVLPVPPFYADGNTIRAVTWFKNNEHAKRMIDQLGFYFDMLKKYDVQINLATTDNPGEIIYEDDFQVGVVQPK